MLTAVASDCCFYVQLSWGFIQQYKLCFKLLFLSANVTRKKSVIKLEKKILKKIEIFSNHNAIFVRETFPTLLQFPAFRLAVASDTQG